MQYFSLRAMFCCCSLSWGAFFFLRGLPLLRLSLALLVENHIRKSCARFRVLLFLCNFFLRETSFPTEKIGRGIVAFAAFPCSPCGKSHFRKSYARLRVLLFLCNFSLRKTSFPTEKIGRGIVAFAAFPCSPCGKLHSKKLRPLSRATFFMQLFP